MAETKVAALPVRLSQDEETEGWTFSCVLDALGRKLTEGSPASRCGFTSSGWPTKKSADERGSAHEVEHQDREPVDEMYVHVFGVRHPDWEDGK